MLKVNNIVFIYNTREDECFVQNSGQSSSNLLTIKGPVERNGEIIGTWFQVDEKENHWISFRPNKYRLNTWEVFYKCVQGEQINYYCRLLKEDSLDSLLFVSFTEKDEWIKDPVSGKWRSKFQT